MGTLLKNLGIGFGAIFSWQTTIFDLPPGCGEVQFESAGWLILAAMAWCIYYVQDGVLMGMDRIWAA
jgi:hypothetical protein